jgi:hypothetical protein
MPQRAGTLNDIGHAHAMLNRHDLALEYYGRALALHEAAGRRAETAATLHNIGRSHHAHAQLALSREHLTRALAIREAINDRPGVAETLVALADVALAERAPAVALDLANQATRLASDIGGRETFWQGRLLAGRAHKALADEAAAAAGYRDAIDTIEALRIDVSSGEPNRQRYFERKLEPYHRLVALSIGRGRVEEALEIAERARARVLLEVVRDGPAARRALTPEERMRERAIEQQLADRRSTVWAARSTAAPDTAALERAERDLDAARLAHGEFRAALYAAHPDLRLQRGDTEAGSLAGAAALIPDDRTALVEFMVADEATYVFVLSRSARAAADIRLSAFELPLTRDRLRERVDDFRQRLERRDLDFQSAARDLFEALLGNAVDLLRQRTNLVIVPDGPLWELPFHALRPGWGGYLIERAAISYAPSIGVLGELRVRQARRSNPPSLKGRRAMNASTTTLLDGASLPAPTH